MKYEERLQKVSVLGAAGKMGSGILLLTALEMHRLSLEPGNKETKFRLYAIDPSEEGLTGLMDYLRAQAQKTAEKNMVSLRKAYAHRNNLVENEDIVRQYVDEVAGMVRISPNIENAYGSTLLLEAASEDRELKVDLFRRIEKNSPEKPWYFTNTSSIPIHILEKETGIEGRILGFHFYNPPAVQKLVELIFTPRTLEQAARFAKDYAKNLGKIVVESNDVAGFIGNGFFMRDVIYSIVQAHKIAKDKPLTEALYTVNKITQDFLLRPMGIFQLIDYVGIDVVQFILKVMDPFFPEEKLQSSLLDQMVNDGIKGGQFSSGVQKDGFFQYEKGAIVGVYDPENKEFISVEEVKPQVMEALNSLPSAHKPWKSILKMPDKEDHLETYFRELQSLETEGARLSIEFGRQYNVIGKKLVKDRVAKKEEDVNTVMRTGFFHAYGPVNDYFG